MKRPTLAPLMLDAVAKGCLSAESAVVALDVWQRWSEQLIVFYQAELDRGQAWSREHNDGREDCAGTYYTDDIPDFFGQHQELIRTYRRIKACLRKPVPEPTEEVEK
jgi:hypothetical protein